MTKATKSLLTASIVFVLPGSLFTSGLVNVENLPALYVLLPTGVVFLGLALLSKVLEKEMAPGWRPLLRVPPPAPPRRIRVSIPAPLVHNRADPFWAWARARFSRSDARSLSHVKFQRVPLPPET